MEYLGDQDIDIESFINVVDKLKKEGFQHVHLLGGEPLMNEELERLIDKFYSLDIAITINTNGTLINDNFVRNVVPKIQSMTISLDGKTPSENDNIRNRGTFNRVLSNIRNYSWEKGFLVLNYVITSGNYKDLFMLVKLSDDIGISRINISWFYDVNMNGAFSPNNISFNSVIDEIEKMLEYASRNSEIQILLDFKPKVLRYFSRIGLGKYIKERTSCNCYGLSETAYLKSDMKLYPCHPYSLKYSGYDIATGGFGVYEENMKKTINSLIVKKKEICNECELRSACIICPFESHSITQCNAVEEREENIFNKYSSSNGFIINPEYIFLGENRIVNLKEKFILEVSDDIRKVIINPKALSISKEIALELYGLNVKGALHLNED